MSNAVVATPLTSQKGDSNGSNSVDIADVVTDVAWLTDQNPQPFIYDAADVNSDTNVNILDVIGTVSMILNPQSAMIASANSVATYTVEDGILYIESDVAMLRRIISILDSYEKWYSVEHSCRKWNRVYFARCHSRL